MSARKGRPGTETVLAFEVASASALRDGADEDEETWKRVSGRGRRLP
jgi:hypothetical protein